MKKTFSLLVIVVFFFFSTEGVAQSPQQLQAINKLFKTSNVVYFKFKVNSMQEIGQFSKMISVDKTKGAEVAAHATKVQFTQFVRMNYPYIVIPKGGAKKAPAKTIPVKKVPVKIPVKKK